MLYHVSEEAGLSRFEPRPDPKFALPVVWAVDEPHLRNYLLPRDCPRVTFSAEPNTSTADRERFLGSSRSVVAFESGWLDRIRSTRLYCYVLPETTFTCVDATAGYYHSIVPVTARSVMVVDDLLAALVSRGVEVRLLPSLWELADAVAASTLAFSIIRMRNATPRDGESAPAPSPSGRGLG